ncbi:vesicle-associated membrane protein-associated protein B [Dendroctonus ponderosae]
MLKQEQVLQIEPQNELKFVGPFSQPVTSYMKLTNPTDKKVLFKIKTTAPKKYCVRPNSGLINAEQSAQIAICLQPFRYDPNEKNKHKFMVQTVFAPETGDANLETLWKEISPEQLMDSKLKCVFEMPDQEQQSGSTAGEAQRATVHSEVNDTPKTAQEASLSHSGDSVELQKATKEIQRLREIESELREALFAAKNEKWELEDEKGLSAPNRYAPPAEQPPTMYFIAIAIVVGLVGILLGKFLL